MNSINLDELEAAILKKRLKFLRGQGTMGKPNAYGLGKDFFKQLDDHWTFCAVLSDVYAVKEMQDQRLDDELSATLPSSTDEEGDDNDEQGLATIGNGVVEKVLRKRATGEVQAVNDDERAIVAVIGEDYLSRFDDPALFDVALNDLHCIQEMRPDLGDEDVAYLVRTADDDKDAEAWMQRVNAFEPSDRLDAVYAA